MIELHRNARLINEHVDEFIIFGPCWAGCVLMAKTRSKPSAPKAFALKTSAMPPTLIRSSSWYLPKVVG